MAAYLLLSRVLVIYVAAEVNEPVADGNHNRADDDVARCDKFLASLFKDVCMNRRFFVQRVNIVNISVMISWAQRWSSL